MFVIIFVILFVIVFVINVCNNTCNSICIFTWQDDLRDVGIVVIVVMASLAST